jgi:putative molybdopterin biosynthesis protein
MSGKAAQSYYLQDVPLEQAQERFRLALAAAGLDGAFPAETIPVEAGLGRVAAGPIWARLSSPHYHAAAMDGYAVLSAATHGASDRAPIELLVGEQAWYVDTGGSLPPGTDAVIPIEAVEPIGPSNNGRAQEAIKVLGPVTPWSHVRSMGEDMVATELVLPAGQRLRPVDLGAITASGHRQVSVIRQARVGIIPTGSELLPAGEEPAPGRIVEFNSIMLAAQVEEWGGLAQRYPIAADDLEAIKSSLLLAAQENDLVLINAGSSAGSKDFTAEAVEALGELLVHGVAVRPGHPVILGMLRAARNDRIVPVVGVPGYPVSAALTGEIFVAPLLELWGGASLPPAGVLTAQMARKVHSSAGDVEYLRVAVGRVGSRWVAAPLARGAGVISSLVRADGIVRIPAGVQGISAGESVQVHLYRPLDVLENTILALGSHDLSLDLLAQQLTGRDRRLTSANLGSLGGLIALGRGEAHLAGSHLLDPESGDYNLSYVREYLPGLPVVIVGLVGREQGLLVSPGNPKSIRGLQDLTRPGVRFVNRQRGAGTRLLLDYHLGKLGVDPAHIDGYEREEFTHLMVAAAVASGAADCGLGIHAAAAALELDFIPLFRERYDLVIPRTHYASPLLEPLLQVLETREFRKAVGSLAGYDVEPMGKIIDELGP